MADIELVIKISEKVYNALTHVEFDANLVTDEMRKSIANGTPLPVTNAGDLISRQAVIDRINRLIEVEKKQGTDDWGYGQERVNAYEAMLYFVKSEYLYPSVEPERKPGKWINVDGSTNTADCSCCGNRGRAWMNYCYECGSTMKGGVICNAED